MFSLLPYSDNPNLIFLEYLKRDDIFCKNIDSNNPNFITVSRRRNILHPQTEFKTVFPLWSAYILILWLTFPFCDGGGFSNGRFASPANVTFYTDRIIAWNKILVRRYFIVFIEFFYDRYFIVKNFRDLFENISFSTKRRVFETIGKRSYFKLRLSLSVIKLFLACYLVLFNLRQRVIYYKKI